MEEIELLKIIFMEEDVVDIYTDGSFDGQYAKWGFVVVKNNERLYVDNGTIYDPIINKGWQIGGECQAVIEAIKYCKANKLRCNIYHDYVGVYRWVADMFDKKAWRANEIYTKNYRNFILENGKDIILSFKKVDAHSGNHWNDVADTLAKGK